MSKLFYRFFLFVSSEKSCFGNYLFIYVYILHFINIKDYIHVYMGMDELCSNYIQLEIMNIS